MQEYRLDAHLETICKEHTSYQNLYSTWTLNKLACSSILKSTLTRYPYFSMHDASHAEAVLSKMEMLLGDRIQNLSPTDTWLLLHAAYAHDLGMVVQWSEIEHVWEQPDFQHFLTSLCSNGDREVREAAHFVQSAQKEIDAGILWPLKAHRYVDLINAAYFRGKHANMSRRYIRTVSSELNLDLGHQGLIQPRIIKLLGNICEIHNAQLAEVLKLDYRTDGVNSDYAHPRFIAMMLRLGDLLDIDNGRFNTASELSFGPLPESSVPHKEKHEATTHLLVTPEEIQFRSNCPSISAYLETRNLVTWLEEEVNFLTVQWPQIAPKELGGYAPRFDQKELLIEGVQDVQELAGSRFEISQEKAFQIIEGSNIYEDRFVFIREILQNAMDASKLQLWRDLETGIYRAWISSPELSKLQPYDLKEEIYNSYPIHVRLSTTPDGLTQVEVEDHGTGISIDGFKNMCHVGTSNSNSSQIQDNLRKMPNWLRPTAGFGVGLQSIFLLTDQFEIDTSTGTESFHATLQTHRTGGYLQLHRIALRPRGTVIRARFRMPEQYSFSSIGDTNTYVVYHMDPIDSKGHIGEARVLEAAREHCKVSMFPIRVTCAETSLGQLEIAGQLPICASDLSAWSAWENRYRFHLNKNCSEIAIWDTRSACFATFILKAERYSYVCFKGIQVRKRTPDVIKNIRSSLDIYGLDTKESLAMDRSSLTITGYEKAQEIMDDLFRVFKAIVLERLEAVYRDPAFIQNFPGYLFWLACDCQERAKIPLAILDSMENTAIVLSKSKTTGKFEKREELVRNLIRSPEDKYFVDIDRFKEYPGTNEAMYGSILSMLDLTVGLENLEIIADPVLTDDACYVSWNYIIPISDTKKWANIYRGTQADTMDRLLLDSQNIRREILLGLGDTIPFMHSNPILLLSERTSNKAKRYSIPATKDYPNLAVTRWPFGSIHPYGLFRYYIVAPFVREEAAQCGELSKDQFVKLVMNSDTFPKTVEYVLTHSPHQRISREEVEASYKQLIEDYYDVVNEQP